MQSIKDSGCDYEIAEGEGAFYGPKIEYTLKDAIGRHWLCGTIQVDFSMPERLGAEYVDANDQRKVPVMLHRAILGSFERFIGILIENYAGAMPPWLAPEHAVVCSISERAAEYAKEVCDKLGKAGLRVKTDLRAEKINRKIREHSMQKLPYILVVGEQEAQSGSVAVRARGGKNMGAMQVKDFINLIQQQINERVNII